MEVRLSSEREAFVRSLVEEGTYVSPTEVVEAGLRLLQARTRASPFRSAVRLGLEQALAGRSAAITVDDVTRRAGRRAA